MAPTPGRIVVGVDGSASSVEAVRWAVRQAGLTGCEVQAVISWEFPKQYGSEFYGQEVNWEGIATQVLEEALSEAARGAAKETPEEASVTITQSVVQGRPGDVLIAAAKGAELLVVGSRGHGGFVGMLVGSVSEQVIAHAGCPVLVVRRPGIAD